MLGGSSFFRFFILSYTVESGMFVHACSSRALCTPSLHKYNKVLRCNFFLVADIVQYFIQKVTYVYNGKSSLTLSLNFCVYFELNAPQIGSKLGMLDAFSCYVQFSGGGFF